MTGLIAAYVYVQRRKRDVLEWHLFVCKCRGLIYVFDKSIDQVQRLRNVSKTKGIEISAAYCGVRRAQEETKLNFISDAQEHGAVRRGSTVNARVPSYAQMTGLARSLGDLTGVVFPLQKF